MLDRQGQVVITDFGLAALADQVPQHDAAQRYAELHGARAARGRRGHGEERHLRAGPRALRDLHRPPRLRLEDARRRSPRRRSETKPRQPVVGREGPRPGGRARDPVVPRARARAPPALGARGGRRAARGRSAGGGARGGRRRRRRRSSPEAGETAGTAAAHRRLFALGGRRARPRRRSWRSPSASSGLDRVGVEPPEALAQKAREILAPARLPETRRTTAPTASAWRTTAVRYFEEKEKPRRAGTRVLAGRPPLVFYWYRTSPRRLRDVLDVNSDLLTPGVVGIWKPPATVSGMVNVGLDARGPAELPAGAAAREGRRPRRTARTPDWDALFAAAGLDRAPVPARGADLDVARGVGQPRRVDGHAGRARSLPLARRGGRVPRQAGLLPARRPLDAPLPDAARHAHHRREGGRASSAIAVGLLVIGAAACCSRAATT